jgi:hypothetical protein
VRLSVQRWSVVYELAALMVVTVARRGYMQNNVSYVHFGKKKSSLILKWR